jgi:putative transcriptional regulator
MKTLHCRLAVLMVERNPRLTQREVAKEAGLSLGTINKLYNDNFDRIDRRTAESLCNYFGCEIEDLLKLK